MRAVAGSRLDSRQLRGGVALELRRLDPGATQLVLDTKDLDILDVTELSGDFLGATEKQAPIWISRPFHLGRADPILGSPLVVDLPPSKQDKLVIRVDYLTSPKARGLRWRSAAGAGQQQAPLLFTLSAPINARSWIPLQDTPQVRASYRVHISSPPQLVALMSASPVTAESRRGDSWFALAGPVAPAALALVVGDLRARATGPRTGVYAEGPVASAAAKQSAGAEALLKAAEKLLGPYRGGRFDVVVMPAAFPVAGLDFPRIALISPTLVAGGRSLDAPLAQALAETWTGGLSGPQWSDRWLGPALAGYLGHRIVAAVHGEAAGRAADDDAAGAAAPDGTLVGVPDFSTGRITSRSTTCTSASPLQ